MLQAQRFHWLPNTITITRMLVAVGVAFAAANGRWALGFWLFLFALGTDFLDGLAAKKLNAQTDLGRQLDRSADGIISGAGLFGLAYTGLISWWVIVIAPIVTLFVAEERFFPFKKGALHRYRPAISVSYLFSVWIFIVLMYATQAKGWHWWYVLLVIVVAITAGSLKRHRLRAWLGMS